MSCTNGACDVRMQHVMADGWMQRNAEGGKSHGGDSTTQRAGNGGFVVEKRKGATQSRNRATEKEALGVGQEHVL